MRQAGLNIGAALLELRQAVEHGVTGGVEGVAARVLRGIKTLGTAFGTVNQRAGSLRGHGHRRQAQSQGQFLQFKHRSSFVVAGTAVCAPC
ncbi:hypothetical protein D3C86_1946510 [compost metagenome]